MVIAFGTEQRKVGEVGMIDRDATVENLKKCIRFVSDHTAPTPTFYGWSNVEMAMRDALELLKEQEAEIERLKIPTAGSNEIPLKW